MTAITLALLLWAQPATPEREIEVREIAAAVEVAAEMSGESPWRLAALVAKESGVRVDVVGKLGELGPGQVRHVYVGMSAEDVATADGGMLAVVRALQRWRRVEPDRYWACFASGNRCHAPRAGRRLVRMEARLRAMVAGHEAAGVIHRFSTGDET